MVRPSLITRQPEAVREAIGAWRQDGFTIDEIVTSLETEYGVELSRSSIHRHVKKLEKTIGSATRTRLITETLAKVLGHDLQSKTARVGIELTHSAMFDILLAEDELDEQGNVIRPGGVTKPQDTLALARSFELLSRARKNDAQLMAMLREEARKELIAETKTAARESGVDESAVNAVMAHLESLKAKEQPA